MGSGTSKLRYRAGVAYGWQKWGGGSGRRQEFLFHGSILESDVRTEKSRGAARRISRVDEIWGLVPNGLVLGKLTQKRPLILEGHLKSEREQTGVNHGTSEGLRILR